MQEMFGIQEVHMTASNGGHSNGLQFYNSRLYSPTNTLRSGDFRDQLLMVVN